MTELLNEVVTDREDTGAPVEPISIRDSLVKAAAEFDTDEQKAERARDEAGRFAARSDTPAKTGEQLVKAVEPAAPPATVATPAVAAPVLAPPSSWAPEAKAEFANASPVMQAAIAKREEEVAKGFEKYQDFKGLEEFTPLVKQHGTTHAEVMKRAIGWEHAIQADPVNAVKYAAHIAGVDITVNGVRQPQQQAAPQQAQQQPVNVEQTVEQILRKRETESQISAFLSDPANPHAEAVLDDMVALINTGRAKTIKDAYDSACWMRPDIRPQLLNQAAPATTTPKAPSADQARRASKSITGSSAPGPSKDAGVSASSSIRDTLKQAMAAQGTRA